MGRAMLSKSLIQFSADGQVCVPFLLFDLSPNYGGGNEDNGNLLQKVPCRHCCMQCPQPWRRPSSIYAFAGDSWTLTDKSGSVSCGVTTPFSWVLVHERFCLCPPRVCFPVPCKSDISMVGLGLLHPEPLSLQQSTSDLYLQRRHSDTVMS